MMDITFNGTAPLRLSVHKGYKVQLEISADDKGSITTVMTIEEALMLSDVLRRMAEEIQS